MTHDTTIDTGLDSACVVIGVSWVSGAPQVRLAKPGQQASWLAPLVGLELNYLAAPSSPRRCLGYVPFRPGQGDYHDCERTPERGGKKCTQCTIVDATFASNLHHAHTRGQSELDPDIVEHLRRPNVLYLAAFRDGSLKIGTSTETRSQKRLTEQGAWRAMLVAEASDGFAVRTVEDAVTAELGIAQSVSIGRKLSGMASPRPDTQLEEMLAQHQPKVAEVVASLKDGRLTPTKHAWSFPQSETDLWAGLHLYPLRLDSGAHHIEVLDVCGRMVVLTKPGTTDRFVADIAQLFGVVLDIGTYEPDELAVQDSLF
jgi:hypothetical protein